VVGSGHCFGPLGFRSDQLAEPGPLLSGTVRGSVSIPILQKGSEKQVLDKKGSALVLIALVLIAFFRIPDPEVNEFVN
jgi:hypothetical protein